MRFRFFKDKSRLYCFTPEVMIATMLTEAALALFVFLRYHSTLFGRITTAILILLAFFQAAEFHICTGENVYLWAQIGFVAITFLPILGYHLILLVVGHNHFLKLGYALTFLFGLYFLFAPSTLLEPVCAGNYIIFQTNQPLFWLYGLFYFSFLLAGIWEIVRYVKSAKKQGRNKAEALLWMAVGYLSFIAPMVFIYEVFGFESNTIPSIMCGFALIFAMILALKVAPIYHGDFVKRKRRKKKTS